MFHWYWVSFLLLLLVLNQSNALLTINGDKNTAIPIYSIYKWIPSFNIENATVIDLFKDKSIFNYCSFDNYTPEKIRPLLQTHQSNNNNFDI